jgi:D-threo-aldose 1-dehydrogenase
MIEPLPIRKLGKTRLQVSGLGLGTAQLGNLYAEMSDAQATEIVQTALVGGITLLDTAPHYGNGLSERRLGLALAGVPRESYVLSTKVGRLIQSDGSSLFDFSRDGVLRSLEASLERLRLDYVDILHIHDPDKYYEQALHDAFPALAELRRQGVIKAISAGMNQWQMLASFARHADFDCFMLAGRYTLLEQEALAEFLPLCEAKGISILAAGIYNSGILARGSTAGNKAKYNYRDAPTEILEKVERIEAICRRFGVELRQAAMQFPKGHPAIAALVVGADNAAELTENLRLYNTPVPHELWDALKAENLLTSAAQTP